MAVPSIRSSLGAFNLSASPTAPIPLGFLPLATSILVASVKSRGNTGLLAVPPGWTALVFNYFVVDDVLQVLYAPAAGITEFPATTWSGAIGFRLDVYEVVDGDIAAISVGVPSTGGAGVTVLGAAAPVRVGQPALAIGIAFGYQGDPAGGCYWITPAGWTGLGCACVSAGGNHPWAGEFSKGYPLAPASIGVTANDSIGQATHGVVMAIGGAVGGARFAGAPGGDLW